MKEWKGRKQLKILFSRCFPTWKMIRCETLVACFTLADTIQNLLENHEVFKIAVFSHCFPIKRKSSYDFVVTA